MAPLLAMAVLLAAVAFLASYWPARRAARLDPAETLRPGIAPGIRGTGLGLPWDRRRPAGPSGTANGLPAGHMAGARE